MGKRKAGGDGERNQDVDGDGEIVSSSKNGSDNLKEKRKERRERVRKTVKDRKKKMTIGEKGFRGEEDGDDGELSPGLRSPASTETASVKKKTKKKERRASDKSGGAPTTPSQISPSAAAGAKTRAAVVVDVESMKGLQIYWNLSALDAHVREIATEALVKEVKAGQETFEGGTERHELDPHTLLAGGDEVKEAMKECSPGLQYALRRLVRGLASSRQGARQGFSLALARLLAELHCVSGTMVMTLIEKELGVTGAMKGQEARDNFNGQIFAFGSIVRSERLIGQGTEASQAEVAREVVNRALRIASGKVFLREVAAHVVSDMAQRIAPSSFESCIFTAPSFVEWLNMESDKAMPEALMLACKTWEYLPMSMITETPLLPNSGQRSDFFKHDHLSVLVPALKASTHCHPRVHTVWQPIIDLLFSASTKAVNQGSSAAPRSQTVSAMEVDESTNGGGGGGKKKKKKRRKEDDEVQQKEGGNIDRAEGGDEAQLDAELSAFWTVVVEGGLVTSSHERKALALELLQLLLPRLRSSHISIVLSRGIMQCLSDSLLSENRTLHLSAKRCLQRLVEWGEREGENNGTRVAILAALQQHGGSGLDKVKGVPLKRLADSLGEKEWKHYVSFLKEQFMKHAPPLQESATPAHKDGTKTENGGVNEEEGDDVDDEEVVAEREKLGAMARKREEDRKIWVVDQLCMVHKSRQLDIQAKRRLSLEILKFLVVHALFEVRKPTKREIARLPEIDDLCNEGLANGVREVCATKLIGLVNAVRNLRDAKVVAVSHHDIKSDLKKSPASKDEEKKNVEEGLPTSASRNAGKDAHISVVDNVLFELIDWIEKIESLSVVTPVHDLSEADKAASKKIGSAVRLMRGTLLKSQGTSNAASVKLRAMCDLLILLRLQLMTEPGALSDISGELLICCKKAFPDVLHELDVQEEKQEEEEEEPAFMDVLVDILLSLLSKPSAGIRDAAEKVFHVFSGMLTETGLKDMLRVVKRPLGDSRPVRLAGVESDDDDDDDGDDESLQGSDDEDGHDHDKDDVDTEEASTDSEMEDTDGHPKKGRHKNEKGASEKNVKKKNDDKEDRDEESESELESEESEEEEADDDDDGSSDDDSSDGEDLDDKAMFRIDEKLAAMFKLRKEALQGGDHGKEMKQEQLRFKFRVLALIERFLKTNSGSPLVVMTVWALIKGMAGAAIAEEGRELTGKIGSVLKVGVCKGREIPKGEAVDIDEVRRLHKRCVLLASQSRHPLIGGTAEACSRWALRVLHANIPGLSADGDAGVSSVYTSSLDKYFLKKGCKLKLDSFVNLIRTYCWLGRGIAARVVMYCEKAKSEFGQVEALKLLLDILRAKGSMETGEGDAGGVGVPRTMAEAIAGHVGDLARLMTGMVGRKFGKPQRYVDALKMSATLLEMLPQVMIEVPDWEQNFDLAGLMSASTTAHNSSDSAKVRAAQERLTGVCETLLETSASWGVACTQETAGKNRPKKKESKKDKTGRRENKSTKVDGKREAVENGVTDGTTGTGDDEDDEEDDKEKNRGKKQHRKSTNGQENDGRREQHRKTRVEGQKDGPEERTSTGKEAKVKRSKRTR